MESVLTLQEKLGILRKGLLEYSLIYFFKCTLSRIFLYLSLGNLTLSRIFINVFVEY